jgi:hypothetical protein
VGAAFVVTASVVVLVLGGTDSVVVLVLGVTDSEVVLVLVVVVSSLHTPPSAQKPSRQTHLLLMQSAFLLSKQAKIWQVPPVLFSQPRVAPNVATDSLY